MKNIKPISLEDCLPLRQKVLWPSLTVEECIDPEDQYSKHVGYILDNQVVSCFSIYPKLQNNYQIRKFATSPSFQRKGIGTKLFTTVLNDLKQKKIEFVTLNARITAVEFYKKFDFYLSGEKFIKKNIPFIPMQIALKDFNLKYNSIE